MAGPQQQAPQGPTGGTDIVSQAMAMIRQAMGDPSLTSAQREEAFKRANEILQPLQANDQSLGVLVTYLQKEAELRGSGAQYLLDIGKETESKNIQIQGKRLEEIVRLMSVESERNFGNLNIIEQGKAGFVPILKFIEAVCEQAGWSKGANFFKGLSEKLQPDHVSMNTENLSSERAEGLGINPESMLNQLERSARQAQNNIAAGRGDIRGAVGGLQDNVRDMPRGTPDFDGSNRTAGVEGLTRTEAATSFSKLVTDGHLTPRQSGLLTRGFAAADVNGNGIVEASEKATLTTTIAQTVRDSGHRTAVNQALELNYN